MRGVLLALLCAACGRSWLPDLEPPIVVPPTATLCGLEPGAWSWTTPQPLPDVEALFAPLRTNPTSSYFDPILSEDGLTLFLSTDLTGPWDVYAVTRPSLTSSFDHIELLGPEVNVPNVTSFGYQPLDSLGRALSFGNFPVDGVTPGTFVVVLADTTASPRVWRGLAIDAEQEHLGDPRLTADGEALIVAAAINEAGLRHIFLSKRTAEGDFGAGALVEGLTEADDSAPWLSPDQRVLLFAHSENKTQVASEIWSATRLDPDAPFANAGPIPALNSPYFDGEPYFFQSGETCELYIVSQQPPGPGFGLYRSFLVRP